MPHSRSNLAKKHGLQRLAASVGDFMRYWGFRRIHGQIWLVVYLSKTPLSGAELIHQLGVSKALVSPALKELMKYGLIVASKRDGRTRGYSANPDVFSVIKKVLEGREKKMLREVELRLERLSQAECSTLDLERLKQVKEMVEAANLAVDWLSGTISPEGFSAWPEIAKVQIEI